MGKKKVASETTEQAIKSGEAVEAKIAKSAGKEAASSKKFDKGRAYIHASYNNTLVSITDDKGGVVAWASAGSLGFTGPKKATPFAASKVVAAIAEKLRKTGPVNLDVYVNGVGGGRDSAVRSLNNQGFNILSIKDVTPIPHNGPRPPKVRRI
jgi:small subunit ribosomal protein S11